MPQTQGETSGLQTASISCNHCGAPLELAQETHFATCACCGARLEVFRQGGAAYTKVLGEIDQRTRRIEIGVEELNLRERLEQLDREWMLERDRYMVRGKEGSVSPPSIGAFIASAFLAIFGVYWFDIAASQGAPTIFPLFGVVFIIAAIGNAVSIGIKSVRYTDGEILYQQRRGDLIADLEKQHGDRF